MSKEVELAFISLDKIHKDETYQRVLNTPRVTKIVDAWDDEKCGAITLARVSKDYYNVIDGQHRLEAAKLKGLKDIPAVIFYGSSTAQQANVFVGVNRDRRTLSSVQLFKASIVAGDPVAVGIDNSLRSAGWDQEYFKAYSSLREAYERHGELWLLALLKVCRRAWTEERKIEARIIQGFTILQAYCNGRGCTMNLDRVEEALAKYPQVNITRRAVGMAETWSGARGLSSALVLLQSYNMILPKYSRLDKIPVPNSPRSMSRYTAENMSVEVREAKKVQPKVYNRVRPEKPIIYSTKDKVTSNV